MCLSEGSSLKLESSKLNLTVYLLFLLIVFGVGKWLIWLWSRRYLYMLSMKLSGPLSLPIIGSLPQLLKLASRKDPVNVMCNFIQSYSGLIKFWLGPDLVIFVSKPEDVEVIMKSKSIMAKPPRFFSFASEMLGAGLLTSIGLDAKWKTHRRIMSPSFNSSVIKSYQPILQRHSEIFLKDLEQLVGKGYEDYHIIVARYIADSVSESMFDFKTNFREGKQDDVIHALDGMTDAAFKKVYKVWYYIDFLYNVSSLKERQMKATNAISRYAKIIYDVKMADYISNNDMRPSVLQNLLQHKVQGELDMSEVLDEIKTIWVAGADTVIGDTCWVLLMLAMHKDAQDKIFQEIRHYYRDDRDAPVENKDLVHFQYLDMCIKEVLRLFPVAPINFRYISGEEITMKHRNLSIPPNTTVGLVLLASHRNPDIWENPHDFIPERFSPEESSKRHQFAYYPFSGGNRNCIGQRYGFNFLKTVTVYILRKYEVHSDMKLNDLGLYYDVNIKPKTGFKAKFTDRIW